RIRQLTELNPQALQEMMRQRYNGHIMVPAAPRAGLVVVQPDLVFAFGKTQLDWPARPALARQAWQRAVRWRIRQIELHFVRHVQVAAQHQPDPCPRHPLAHDTDAQERERADDW